MLALAVALAVFHANLERSHHIDRCAGPDACAQTQAETPTREQTRAFLARLSITPDTACAAGLSTTDVTTLFQVGGDTLDTLAISLDAASQSVANARAQLVLTRGMAASEIEPSLDVAIQQAEAALATAVAAQTQLSQSAFDTVIAPLVQQQRTLLATQRANADRPVPTEFKVITRSAEDWDTLQKALQHVKARQACGLTPTSSKLQTVSTAAAQETVYAAKQRLDTLLPSIKAAWSATE